MDKENTMPKVKVACGCGGSFEDTPSGKSKHVHTAKHVGWVTAAASRAESKAKAGGKRAFHGHDEIPSELPGKDGVIKATNAVLAKIAARPVKEKVEQPVEPEPEKAEEPTEDAPSEAKPVDPNDLSMASNNPFGPGLTDGYGAAIAATGEANNEFEAAKDAVAKYKRYVRYGELHSPKNLPKYQQQLEEAEERFAIAGLELVAAKDAEQEAAVAAREDKDAYWIRVHRAVMADLRSAATFGERLNDVTVISTLGGLTVAMSALPIEVVGPHRGLLDGQETIVGAQVRVKLDALVAPSVANQLSRLVWMAGRYAATLETVIGLNTN